MVSTSPSFIVEDKENCPPLPAKRLFAATSKEEQEKPILL